MAASRATLTAIARLRRVQEIEARRALETLKVALDDAFARQRRAALKLTAEEHALDRARKHKAQGHAPAGKIQRIASFVDGQRARVKAARISFRSAAREFAEAERALDKGRKKLEHAIASREAVEAHTRATAAREERAHARRIDRQSEDRWRPKRE